MWGKLSEGKSAFKKPISFASTFTVKNHKEKRISIKRLALNFHIFYIYIYIYIYKNCFIQVALNCDHLSFVMLQKISIHPKNPKKICSQKYKAAKLFSTLMIIRNVSCATNQHIRMISEGSCDIKFNVVIQE